MILAHVYSFPIFYHLPFFPHVLVSSTETNNVDDYKNLAKAYLSFSKTMSAKWEASYSSYLEEFDETEEDHAD